MKKFLDKIMLLDLFAGLGITFKNMLKKNVTVQYPEARLDPAHRWSYTQPRKMQPAQLRTC